MDIGWYRDLAIIILAVVAAGVLIIITVLAVSLYRRMRYILDSERPVAKTVQQLSSYLNEEVIKPVVQISTLVHGIWQGIDSLSKLFRRKGGRDE